MHERYSIPNSLLRAAGAMALGVVALAGCDDEETKPGTDLLSNDPATADSADRPSASDSIEAPDIRSDAEIDAAVAEELLGDPSVPPNVEVRTVMGVVTLEGTVDNLLAAQRAVRIAETVRGVRVVDDELTVEAPKIDDDELRRDVEQALLLDSAADRFELDVKADDGHVTLEGTVQSHAEFEHSARVAMGVRGVEKLTNSIVIEYADDRSDFEIERDINKMLRWDALVDDPMIDVEVHDGEVVLTGTVGSVAERRRARTDAWVAGVEDVDVSGLDVEPWARDRDRRRFQTTIVPDPEIEDAIELAAAMDPRVASFNITPIANGGIVTLTGQVDNAKAKMAAEEIANHTIGVSFVINHIGIDRTDSPSDETLRDNIEDALLRNPITESFEIDVSVDDGRAILTGTVDNYSEFAEASDVALGMKGIWWVDNRLEVAEPAAYVRDPYGYPYYPYVTTWNWYAPAPLDLSDAELAEEIREELFWSPFVDRGDVTVVVDDGVATLAGTVDSWHEFHSAAENALEAGALAVDNDLTVVYSD